MTKAFSITRIYQLLILILLLLLLWQWHCGGGKACPAITETVRVDTVIRVRVDSSAWTKPQPIVVRPGKIPQPQVIILPGTTDTVWTFVDTAAIISDYYVVADYDTTYKFPEADIKVQSSVSENRLQLQRVLPTFRIPEITKTITQAEKKRGQVFIGVEAFGGPQEPLFGGGASLMYKTKGDKVYEVGPVLFKDQPLMFKAGAKFLISFRK